GGGASIEVQRIARSTCLVDQVLCLRFADCDTVEGDVVVDGIGVEDQAIVGDNLHACFARGLGSTILRGQDQHLNTLGDQVFNVGFLFCRIALAEEDLHVITSSYQGFFETSFVLNPAGLVLGREDDPNCQSGG